MREIDRRAIEGGIPGLVLMENAGLTVVEFLESRFAPLASQRVVVFCGKGNNGGDGLVVARYLHTTVRPAALHVILAEPAETLRGDAATNFARLQETGCPVQFDITHDARRATIVLDALLGTGLNGPPRGRYAELIAEINTGFPSAKVIAIDVPSGIGYGGVRASATVTFVSPKLVHYQEPDCDDAGELIVTSIGTPPELLDDPELWLSVSEATDFRDLFLPRARSAHKGHFGHVLVVGGAPGKTGAAAMAGMAALRAGAGLVTVAASTLSGFPPELMTVSDALAALDGKTVLAAGPGLGTDEAATTLVRQLLSAARIPTILDADALTVIAASKVDGELLRDAVLTPHPGEMSRLTGLTTAEIQRDRIGVARRYSTERRATLVLKGRHTLIAYPDGTVWINPTGGPAMAKGGSGDILTGLIAGMVAQFPERASLAVRAAVWLHGRAGDLGATVWGDKSLLATDLLQFLPRAMEECAGLPN
jgi:ADP-dependent NAD(P)H-hydrate dehydratase / NAD(P)H-hydrate epimerase